MTETRSRFTSARRVAVCRALAPVLRDMAPLVLLLAAAAPLHATAAGDDPSASVRAALAKASAAAAEQTRDAQLAHLRIVAHALVDTREMGRRAIGARFNTYTEAQQQEFLRLFDELFVRSYLQKLLLFRNPTFRVGREQQRGDTTFVPTQIVVNEDSYAVEYEMLRENGEWRASDVVVEGVSMTSNYSDQFASLLRDRSFDELLDLMRRKVEHIAETK